MLGALSGSPAAHAGVRYGDVLLSVNGVRTKTASDYVDAKALRKDGMDVVLFRDGAELHLDLVYRPDRGPPDVAMLIAELVSMRVAGGLTDDPEKPPGERD